MEHEQDANLGPDHQGIRSTIGWKKSHWQTWHISALRDAKEAKRRADRLEHSGSLAGVLRPSRGCGGNRTMRMRRNPVVRLAPLLHMHGRRCKAISRMWPNLGLSSEPAAPNCLRVVADTRHSYFP